MYVEDSGNDSDQCDKKGAGNWMPRLHSQVEHSMVIMIRSRIRGKQMRNSILTGANIKRQKCLG